MFNYYGNKKQLVNYYPEPVFNTIIEPFAGSARYSLKYFDRNIILIEKFDKVYKIWKYLQQASIKDILSLPVNITENLKYIDSLCDEERWLIGFYFQGSGSRPKYVKGKWSAWNIKNRNILASELFKIKNWDIRLNDYTELENIKATWFIDPPYQKGGYAYTHNKIDYVFLKNWCLSREGQIIVCGNNNDKWLDFKPLKKLINQKKKITIEGFYERVNKC